MKASKTGAYGKHKSLESALYSAILLFLLVLSTHSASAQKETLGSPARGESSLAAQVRGLNNNILQLHGQLQENPSSAVAIRTQGAVVIAKRAAALTTLIQHDPRAALSFAFSPELLADLAQKFPQSASLLESHTTVSGQLEHWIEDGADLKTSRSYFLMKVGGRTLNLHFAGPEPMVKAREVLEATGVMVGSEMAVASTVTVSAAGSVGSASAPITPRFFHTVAKLAQDLRWPISASLLGIVLVALVALPVTLRSLRGRIFSAFKQFAVCAAGFVVIASGPTVSYAQTCSTTGVQNTAVILVTFPGVTPPSTVTPQSVYNIFFGSTAPSVSDFWRETSYGQTTAAGDVFGWYTLTGSYTCATIYSMEQDAINAAAAGGANFQKYTRVFVIFPEVALQCGWAGLSTIGCSSTLTSPSGPFTASLSLIDAGAINLVETAAHEGGHSLGLNHASTRGFGTEPLGPVGTTGTLTEYGDKFSTMACCDLAEYGSPHKAEELNWLKNGVNYQVVQSSGTHTLQPLEASPAGLQALKVQRGAGNNAWLWIEYRQPVGNYDPTSFPNPWLSTLPPQPYSGALIHYEDSTTGLYTHLLNFTPTDSSFLSPALVAGQSWVDPYTNLSISVLSATSSGLTVSVNYGTTPCTSSAPSVTVSPLNPSIYPGQSASYSVSVTNNDSSGCSSSMINLASTEPSGWSTSLSSSSVTLNPGQSASVSLGKGAPVGTPASTYAVNLNGSKASSTGTGMANATVVTPPSLSVLVSVPSSSYNRKSTLPITATVLSSGSPASGASVTFTLTTSDGGKVTQTATAGSSGTATWSYKLSPQAPTGTYSVSAQASLSSTGASATLAATSNTVTFTVQ